MIYEYRCSACEKVNEFQMKLSDPHPETCPSCAATHSLERMISKTDFALKGAGWYTTDYKRPSTPPVSKENGAEKASESKVAEVAPPKSEPTVTPKVDSKTVAPKVDSKLGI